MALVMLSPTRFCGQCLGCAQVAFLERNLAEVRELLQPGGGFAGEGDSDHPAAWSSPIGIPPQDWGQMLRAELLFAGRWILGNP